MRAAIALLAGLFAATALSVESAAPSPQPGSKCRAAVVYNSVKYYGLESSHLRLQAGGPAGFAREPVCHDPPPPCRPGETCDPPRVTYRRVAVRRIIGVRPRVAIARRDVPNVIYIAADRCRGFAGALALVRCLRRSR